jgi:hypothetical protein
MMIEIVDANEFVMTIRIDKYRKLLMIDKMSVSMLSFFLNKSI